MPTVITLTPPRDPAGRGPDRRWHLNIAGRPVGRIIELAGIRADEVDKAMAAANAELGFEATWRPVGHSWRAEPLVIGTEAAA